MSRKYPAKPLSFDLGDAKSTRRSLVFTSYVIIKPPKFCFCVTQSSLAVADFKHDFETVESECCTRFNTTTKEHASFTYFQIQLHASVSMCSLGDPTLFTSIRMEHVHQQLVFALAVMHDGVCTKCADEVLLCPTYCKIITYWKFCNAGRPPIGKPPSPKSQQKGISDLQKFPFPSNVIL